MLVDLDALLAAYYDQQPDPSEPSQLVAFGTSGHRGSSFDASFNEAHILATTQAICAYRAGQGIDGPLFLGRDTHGLSEPAFRTAVEVLVANDVEVLVDSRDGYTPTPALSHAILRHNERSAGNGAAADGIVVTPSHNPPEDGGFKYNPPNGGPAGGEVTGWIEEHANELLAAQLEGVRRTPWEEARSQAGRYDFRDAYLDDLHRVIDVDAIRGADLRLGVHPLGGASVEYWEVLGERFGFALEVVDDTVDARFGFMTLDSDGKIRMDCSSADAMASLISLRDRFDVAFGNDADADRHGIVTPEGLMNPNHYLAVAISYLLRERESWPRDAGVGKTLVSSVMIDRVVEEAGRKLVEVPVGFKWFVEGLADASLVFGGEESAGASLLTREGKTWTTDKDGIALDLLAAEITAKTGRSPAEHYAELTERHGDPVYRRTDFPASSEEQRRLKELAPDDVQAEQLAGAKITAMLTEAPGNGAAIGGLKVVTEDGWFAARPSGTEQKNKIYAESLRGEEHLEQLLEEAQEIVSAATGD